MSAPPFDQASFVEALLNPTLPPPCGFHPRRFSVYRNNVMFALIEALGERFPVCRRLVGDECFDATAALFARASPPRSPVMQEYGEGFPEFLEALPPLADFAYLGDVGRFELALGRAYHAPDATPLAPTALAKLSPETLDRCVLMLHPSVELMASSHPVLSIWRAHQDDAPIAPIIRRAMRKVV